MAALDSPQPPPLLPTPSPSVGRRSAAPTAPKLRDSCHGCASSKLKCLKEKPTCSRCAKRGLVCEYVATKRGGRKHDRRSSNERRNNMVQPLPPLTSWFTPNSTVLGPDALPSPGGIPSPGTTTAVSSNLFPNILSPADQTLSSGLTDLNADLDSFFASPISFSMPDLSDTDILSHTNFFSTGVDSNSSSSGVPAIFDPFPGFDGGVNDILALSNPRSPLNSRASPTSDTPSYQGSHATDLPCFCLVRALSLMTQLFPNPSTACTTLVTQGFNTPNTPTAPTIQDVIAKNERTIDAVSTMLQCTCSQDGYLLAIISLIVFKILGWYGAAARKAPAPSDDNYGVQSPGAPLSRKTSYCEQVALESPIVGSYCLEGIDSARMAAQLVLGELHRVQRLINQLSTKLKAQTARGAGIIDAPASSGCEDMNTETTFPISTVMMDQLDADLRKRLKALSLEIVEGLRRE